MPALPLHCKNWAPVQTLPCSSNTARPTNVDLGHNSEVGPPAEFGKTGWQEGPRLAHNSWDPKYTCCSQKVFFFSANQRNNRRESSRGRIPHKFVWQGWKFPIFCSQALHIVFVVVHGSRHDIGFFLRKQVGDHIHFQSVFQSGQV